MDNVGFMMKRSKPEDRKCTKKDKEAGAMYCSGDVVGVAGIDGCIRAEKSGSFITKVAQEVAGVVPGAEVTPEHEALARKVHTPLLLHTHARAHAHTLTHSLTTPTPTHSPITTVATTPLTAISF